MSSGSTRAPAMVSGLSRSPGVRPPKKKRLAERAARERRKNCWAPRKRAMRMQWAILFDRYARLFLVIAFRILRDPAKPEDIGAGDSPARGASQASSFDPGKRFWPNVDGATGLLPFLRPPEA